MVAAAVTATMLSAGVLAACGDTSNDTAASDAASDATTTAPADHSTTSDHGYSNGETAGASAQTKLYTAMRTLWGQHMEWTWSAVVAFATDSPALQPTLDRLLKNQADIGDAVGSYYGADAGAKATDLLETHINQAVPVLQAAKAGDKAALDKALADWYANAQEIADFLAGANPDNWEQSAVRGMMKTHIDQTTAYASAVLTGDYEGAIKTYDEAAAHMAEMADALSAGIVAQFPDKF